MKIALAATLAAFAGPAIALDRPVPAQPIGKVVIGKGSTGTASDLCAALPGSNLCRPLGERLTDVLGLKDYGAKLDASQDDAQAYRSAKAAALAGQRISVPAGMRYTLSDITGPRPVWWDINGALTFPGGSPSPSIGDDLTSSVVNGRTRLWWRENPIPRADPVFRVERTDTSQDTGPDFIQNANVTNCNVKNKSKSIYCNVTFMRVHSANGASAGAASGHIATLAIAERSPDSPPNAPFAQAFYAELNDGTNLNDSADNGNAGMAMSEQDFYTHGTDTKNYRALVAYRIGSYDNQFSANTTAGSTTITGINLRFALPVGRTVRGSCLPGGLSTVASYAYADTNSTITTASPATTTGSCNMTVDVTPGEVGRGIELVSAASSIGGRVGIGYSVNMPFYGAGFDTALGRADSNAPSFRMAEGQKIAFDGTGEGYFAAYNRSMRYTQGSLRYKTPAGDVFQITDAGKALASGGLQVPDLPAPSGPSDPIGDLGDVRFNGPYMFRKTTSGWLRFTGTTSWP